MKVERLKFGILAVVFSMIGGLGTAQAVEFESSIQGQSLTAKDQKKQDRRTLRGYKASVDAGFMWLQDDIDDNPDKFAYDVPISWDCIFEGVIARFTPSVYVSTVHGYQFNNFFFLGGGVEASYYTDRKFWSLPVFLSAKVNFLNKKVTPFLDSRVGYAFGKYDGGYWSETLGVRIATGKKAAVNFGFEFRLKNSPTPEPMHFGFGTRIGVEF